MKKLIMILALMITTGALASGQDCPTRCFGPNEPKCNQVCRPSWP